MSVAVQKLRKARFNKNLYSHRRTFGAPTVPLPPTLGRTPLSIKDQGITSYCTAFATAAVSEYQEKMILSPEYQTAKEGQYQGKPIYDGTSPEVALETARKYGSLPQEQSPLLFSRDGWLTPAEWRNYPPTLDGQAIMHRKDSYYHVTKSYQGIKDALFQAKAENGVVLICGRWFSSWNNPVGGIVPTPSDTYITLHAYVVYDWMTCADGVERLKCQLSQGKSFGDAGTLYLSPDCIKATFGNSWAGTDAFIFRDDNGQNNIAVQITKLQELIGILRNLIELLKRKTAAIFGL